MSSGILSTVLDKILSCFRGVVDRITKELKQILKRDFNKKMIEGNAFQALDEWWDKQELASKVIIHVFIYSLNMNFILFACKFLTTYLFIFFLLPGAVLEATIHRGTVEPKFP